MRLRLLAVFLGLTLVFLVVHDVPLGFHLARVERDRIYTAMERDAFTISGKVADALDPAALGTADSSALLKWAIDSYTVNGDAKVVIVDNGGYLAATSDDSDTLGADFTNRPEIAEALLGGPSSGVRISETTGGHLVYVAVPVLSGATIRGVVRLTVPETAVNTRVRNRIIGIVLADIAGPPEIRELAQSFNEMADRLGRVIEQQRQFSGDASHQLRTPLTALRLRLERAATEVSNDPEAALGNIEAAMAEADRLRRLIEQLLQLARSEGAIMQATKVDLTALVEGRFNDWLALAEERGDTLRCNVEQGLFVNTVAPAVEQIVDNFIDNAIEYTPAGTTIEVGAQRVGDRIEIFVSDNGLGMSTTSRTRAFDRFWRGAEASTRTEGTGLGLAIVQQLANVISGRCELRENTPSGVIAVLSIPA